MPHDKVVRDTKLPSKITDLILEELTERLNKLQSLAVEHALRKSKVVVGLDSGTGALERNAISSMLVNYNKTRQIRALESLSRSQNLNMLGY